MPELYISNQYNKKAIKFLVRHPELIDKYEKTLYLLKENPFHPSLRSHKLKGALNDFQSVSISLIYRIVIDFIIRDDIIILIDIGDHGDVYRQ